MAKKSNRLSSGPPGGGFGSKQHVRTGVRTGQSRQGKNVRAVSQIGSSLGNHATDRAGLSKKPVERIEGGRGISVPLGNELAKNVGKGGPGAGRNLYGQSGSNQVYGPVAGSPKPQGRDILNDFGPDSKRGG
jgi:hypothetical protein